jgi:MFS family permease
MAAAAPLLAVSLTKDPVLIALSGAMYLLPWLFFAIAIGTLVDRIDRRGTLFAVAIFRALVAIALAWLILTNSISIYLLLIATFLIGTADVFNDTALQSLIPTILDKDKLERGNSRFQMSDTVLQQFIGVPLGSVLFVLAAFVPFGLDALGFAVAAILLILIPRKHIAKLEVPANRPGFKVQMMEGITFLWNDKKILRLVVVTALIGFGFNIAGATMVLYLTETLQVAKASYGLVLLVGGVGALIGAWLAPKTSKRFGRGLILALSITFTGVFELAMGFAPNVLAFVLFSFGGGLAISGWNVLLMSVYHSLIPNEVFGRVHGTRRTLVWGLMPIGAFIGGLVAREGLRLPFYVGGGFAVLVALVSFAFIVRTGNQSVTENVVDA